MLISPLYHSQPSKSQVNVRRVNQITRKRKLRLATEAAFLATGLRLVKGFRNHARPIP